MDDWLDSWECVAVSTAVGGRLETECWERMAGCERLGVNKWADSCEAGSGRLVERLGVSGWE